MVFLTLVIGLLNLCLGYALAVHMGYARPDFFRVAGSSRASSTVALDETEFLHEQLAASPLESMLDDGPVEPDSEFDGELDVEAYEEAEDVFGDELDPDAPEDWDPRERYVETSLLKLNIAMMKSGVRAANIDTQLRACRGQSSQGVIQKSLELLKEDCETYLAEQSELAERFHDRIGELGELSALGDEIEVANLEQAAQVETTLSNLAHMDFESDLEAANLRLLEEINNLRVARHKLRDSQDVAFLAIAQYENRMEKIEKQLYNDPLTGLRNRIGLETTLWQWWKQDRQKSRQISAALFDLDAFGPVNEHHGSQAADRILQEVGKVIKEAAGDADLFGRFAGQQFLMMIVDVGPRTATKTVETVRQSIEKITFKQGDVEISMTLGGAIAEVSPDDTLESLEKKLEATLAEAKQSGPNCTFFHNGKEAELVESPNFGAQYRDVSI